MTGWEMNKVFLLGANENWICDRFVSEWYDQDFNISTKNIHEANVLWLVAGWCWNQVSPDILNSKKVIITIHHIVPEKFDERKKSEFVQRDRFIDLYHVPCEKTKDQIKPLTEKPIVVSPFWSNQKLWFPIENKDRLREKYGINQDAFLVGSFQRDTEGHDLISPKLEKGPDLFCDYVEKLSKEKSQKVEVLLAGWRRQYVMSRLKGKNISFYYSELPDFGVLNDLYNCLDLYVVAARCEGGPQAIAECSLSKTPIVSTDVGLASMFLHSQSIFDENWDAKPNTEHAFSSIQDYTMPAGFKTFKTMIGDL
tara:strand:- start:180 stop:1109 length:930 start_codon:yes stop_codon:yes gene_type:complete